MSKPYVERALADCVAQGHKVAIEDPATLDFLAEVLSHPGDAVHNDHDHHKEDE